MTDAFQTRLDGLRVRGRMAMERLALQNAVGGLGRGDSTDLPREEIRRIVHSLGGGGGTFGFTGVSACATALEEFVMEAPEARELVERCRTLALDIERAVGLLHPTTWQSLSIHYPEYRVSKA